MFDEKSIEKDLQDHGYKMVKTLHCTENNIHIEVLNGRGYAFDCKVYVNISDAKMLEKYNTEKDILGTLIHPNIVETYDFFQVNNHAYLIFELCQSLSLESTLNMQATHTEKTLCSFIAQIMNAISYLHANGISHNNITPHNIMFDRFGRVKLVEFDHAKINNQNQKSTISDDVKYPFAPESYGQGEYDLFSADIWAFGAVSYYLLSGEYPWTPENELSYVESITESLKKIYGKYDDKIIQLIANCLSENPSDRPVAAAIQSYFAYSGAHCTTGKGHISKHNSNVIIPKIKRISSNNQCLLRRYSTTDK